MRARTISRIMLGFLATFLLACVAVLALHVFYLWPKRDCEAGGRWWSPEDWRCATPVSVHKLTGRPLPPLPDAAPETPVAAPAAKAD